MSTAATVLASWPFAGLIVSVMFGFLCRAGRDPKGDMLNGPQG